MGFDPVLAAFSDALEYPGDGLSARVSACIDSVGQESPEAAALLAGFREVALRTAPGRLEELYTAAFDLQDGCAPYLSAHLFPGDPRRGEFLARLAGSYRARGFSAGDEPPDHLGAVLRYLAANGDDEEAAELLGLAVLPAVTAVAEELARQRHPWEPLIRALCLVVRARTEAAGTPAATEPQGPVPSGACTGGAHR